MLVTTRTREEKLMLDYSQATDEQLLSLRDNPTEIQLLEVRGEKVRLGTTAPKFVRVDREEVYKARRAAPVVPTPEETEAAFQDAVKQVKP